jgi:hypothetical protein
MENLFWGFVYNVGFEIVYALGLMEGVATLGGQPATAAAGLLWPVLVSIGLFYLGRHVWSHANGAIRIAATSVFITSMLFVVPVRWLQEYPFNQIPLYASTVKAIF